MTLHALSAHVGRRRKKKTLVFNHDGLLAAGAFLLDNTDEKAPAIPSCGAELIGLASMTSISGTCYLCPSRTDSNSARISDSVNPFSVIAARVRSDSR